MAEDQTTSYKEKYSSLTKKKQLELVDMYNQLDAFLSLMDEHDDEMRLVNMSLGWDKVVGVVHQFYPDVVHSSLFPSHWAMPLTSNISQASCSSPKMVSQCSGSSSSHKSSHSKRKAPVRENPRST